MLMPILRWLLNQHCPDHAVDSYWADLGRLPQPPRSLPDKIKITLEYYPCDILFIHRDAEKESYETRYAQIQKALVGIQTPPTICVIPVRMQEAWLLFDQAAIRRAAGNPNGRIPLAHPDVNTMERLPDPKKTLFDLIRTASNLKGARLKKLNPHKCAFLVSDSIEDFSPLRPLNAFQALEKQLKNALCDNGFKK